MTTTAIDFAGFHALAVEQDAVVIFKMHPFVRQPLADPRAACSDRLVDGDADHARRQRPAVRGRPAHHRLLVDRLRVLDPRPADAVLRLRPRRVHRRAATSTCRSRRSCPGRIVRTFAELLDAIRRDDYEVEKVARVRGAPLRPPRRRVDRPGHRRARSSPDEPVIVRTIRIARSSGSRSRSRVSSRCAAAWSWRPRTPTTLGGNLASIRDELARRRPAGPGRRPRAADPRRPGGAGSPPRGRRSLAGYHLATARVFVVDDYFFPIYVIRPRAGTTIVQTWHACGAFKKFGYSVLDKSFGADEALTRQRPDPQQLRRLPRRLDVRRRRTTPRPSGSRWSASVRDLGIPRTDVLFGEERIARTTRGGPPRATRSPTVGA